MSPVHGHGIGLAAGGHLDEHRVVEGRDDRSGEALGAVEPDAESARRTVGEDFSVIRHELIFGILGGDAALDGVTAAGHLVLHRHADFGAVQRVSLRDEDLGAHQVEAGDDLGDGVLDLDARVHLDEKPFVAVEIEEKLDGAGIVVMDPPGHARRGVA